MKLAIMQPYFFPYIGYFQMVNSVDTFIFYDDVNFIKRGWINRNKIMVNGEERRITINLLSASQNKLINEIQVELNFNKLIKTIKMAYSKAPFFEQVFPLIQEIMQAASSQSLISEIAGQSVIKVSEYLKLDTVFEFSSVKYADSKGMDKADRLIEICNRNNAKIYINAIGGKELYSKAYFKTKGIELLFIQNQIQNYKQFENDFIPYLSIVDVLMFNSVDKIRQMLNQYTLI